jgi:acyl-CoA reductase-like NAD-dependent aldehyde dehydrogenase
MIRSLFEDWLPGRSKAHLLNADGVGSCEGGRKMQEYKMWIGGQWVKSESGATYTVMNPATEEEIAIVPLGDKADVDKAVVAAREAFPVWSRKTQAERCRVIGQIADALRANVQELVELDVLDHGTPKQRAQFSIQGAIANLEFAAQASRSLTGSVIPVRPNSTFFYQREPIGVCALIIPWNVPLPMICAKMGYALAVGNTCIVKPPSVDSLVTLKLGEILEKLDIPSGAINIITGPGGSVGEAIATHPGIDLISFTGSSETGKTIMAAASATLKRLTLELGGKNPFIVLEDADLGAAVAKGVFSSYANTGMICASPGRYYIHESLYNEFADRFVETAKKIVVGDPNDMRTEMGPVVSAEHRDKVEGYIRSGIDEGARLLLGGLRPASAPLNKGYFVMPCVFGDVAQNMTIAREEIFGPVACLMKFSSEEEVITAANDNTYGLCASIWTKHAARGIKLSNKIDAGFVYINDHLTLSCEQPWGGFKGSGFGKENSILSLESYTRIKGIAIELA